MAGVGREGKGGGRTHPRASSLTVRLQHKGGWAAEFCWPCSGTGPCYIPIALGLFVAGQALQSDQVFP